MGKIPIDSKQIDFVDYDDVNDEMTLYYHTGQIRTYCQVSKDEFLQFLHSPNKYDYLVELTSKSKQQHKQKQ